MTDPGVVIPAPRGATIIPEMTRGPGSSSSTIVPGSRYPTMAALVVPSSEMSR
ncbi:MULTISPECIES: hypothetical protein [unclassified Streptosporangium]|uniref:hypothetical protein n=1 Tax=Streptosporangium sp. NPDC005286 TaxID=3154463 RepID=UPI0033B45FEB